MITTELKEISAKLKRNRKKRHKEISRDEDEKTSAIVVTAKASAELFLICEGKKQQETTTLQDISSTCLPQTEKKYMTKTRDSLHLVVVKRELSVRIISAIAPDNAGIGC